MKFIHIADVHLGAFPDAGSPWSQARQAEIWDTFRAVIADAGRLQADLLLIAGDLFHAQPAVNDLREAAYLFSTIPKTRIVLIAGNHDYIGPSSPYLTFPWPRNVAGLFSDTMECVRFPEIRTDVYGLSYHRQNIEEPLYDDFRPIRDRNFKILLAHGGDPHHIPINPGKLKRSGFDYIALGHIHKGGALIEKKAMYSGALEPIDPGDLGPHGYILGEVQKGHLTLQFVPCAKREYRLAEVTCTQDDSTFSVCDALHQYIQQEGPQNIYRVSLRGFRQPGMHFDERRIRECGCILDVQDQTRAAWNLEELKRKYQGQIIGRFVESFEGHDRSAVEERAMQYGLEALLEAQDTGQE